MQLVAEDPEHSLHQILHWSQTLVVVLVKCAEGQTSTQVLLYRYLLLVQLEH